MLVSKGFDPDPYREACQSPLRCDIVMTKWHHGCQTWKGWLRYIPAPSFTHGETKAHRRERAWLGSPGIRKTWGHRAATLSGSEEGGWPWSPGGTSSKPAGHILQCPDGRWAVCAALGGFPSSSRYPREHLGTGSGSRSLPLSAELSDPPRAARKRAGH